MLRHTRLEFLGRDGDQSRVLRRMLEFAITFAVRGLVVIKHDSAPYNSVTVSVQVPFKFPLEPIVAALVLPSTENAIIVYSKVEFVVNMNDPVSDPAVANPVLAVLAASLAFPLKMTSPIVLKFVTGVLLLEIYAPIT